MTDERIGTNSKDVTIAWLSLARGLAWPAIVAVLIYLFSTPLLDLVRFAPALLGRANIISFGDVRVELSSELSRIPDTDIRLTLSKLDESDVRNLLLLSVGAFSCPDPFPDLINRDEYVNLKRLKLVAEKEQDNKCKTLILTEKGERVRNFLFEFLSSTFAEKV